MVDIVALGELLIDFTPAGKSAANNELFECNPGGSVANFAVSATKLGAKTSFIGQVGQDQFGRFLQQTLRDYDVDIRGLILTPDYMTTLAFVHLFPDGDRDFSFYRKNGADAFLHAKDVDLSLIDEAKALHFSSLSLVNETCTEATWTAVQHAREKGAIVTYDPNWRPSLWDNEDACKAGMQSGLPRADVVKVSEEELVYLTGLEDNIEAGKVVLAMGPRLVIETCGGEGSRYHCAKGSEAVPGFKVKAVDATGAGDACFGAIVSGLLREEIDLDDIDTERLKEIMRFANAAAAMSVTGRGGMPSLQTRDKVEAFIAENS